MVRLLARLKDGTQEFVRDEDDLINLIEDRLGKDISDEIKSIIEDSKSELQNELELEQDDDMYELESALDNIRDLADDLIDELSALPELQEKVKEIKYLALC